MVFAIGRPRMAATVADACGLPPGARFLVSFSSLSQFKTISGFKSGSSRARECSKENRIRHKNLQKMARGVHLVSSPGARPSGRFTIRAAVNETIDLRAGDVETA